MLGSTMELEQPPLAGLPTDWAALEALALPGDAAFLGPAHAESSPGGARRGGDDGGLWWRVKKEARMEKALAAGAGERAFHAAVVANSGFRRPVSARSDRPIERE